MTKSFQQYGTMPSAIVSDGILTIPLWAVTTMTLTESYHLPPIGATGSKSVIGSHDDSITLAGVLVGAERYAWKLALETLAESSRRGSALASFTGGAVGGLVLITSMTIRTDMQMTSLTFTASAARRDALDVSIGMAHLPLPSALGKLLDVASVGVGALADLGGN
jgi:hypothetical protein